VEAFVLLDESAFEAADGFLRQPSRRNRDFHEMNLQAELHLHKALENDVFVPNTVFPKLPAPSLFEASEDLIEATCFEGCNQQLRVFKHV